MAGAVDGSIHSAKATPLIVQGVGKASSNKVASTGETEAVSGPPNTRAFEARARHAVNGLNGRCAFAFLTVEADTVVADEKHRAVRRTGHPHAIPTRISGHLS